MKSPIVRLFLGALLAGALSAAQADGLIRVEQTVFGMDCAPCAYGLQKGLTKLPGATKVEVSLNDGKAVVEFSPGSPTSFSQVHDVIVHGGFTPREATVVVAGHVAMDGDKLVLVANGSERYRLIVPQAADPAAFKPGAEITVQGEISAESSSDPEPGLTVEKVLPNAP